MFYGLQNILRRFPDLNQIFHSRPAKSFGGISQSAIPDKIEKSAEVEDYFKVFSPQKSISEYYSAHGDNLTKLYENNEILVFPKFPFQMDYEFLSKVSFPMSRKFKKLRAWQLRIPLTKWRKGEADFEKHPLLEIFKNDAEKALYFQELVESGNSQLRIFARTLFPKYRFHLKDDISWRFSETENEDMHFDSYGETAHDNRHRVRIFWNLDDTYRVWNVSHRLPSLLNERRSQLDLDKVRNLHPDEVNRFLNEEIFGGLKNRQKDKEPRHICYLAPGTVWMANSQMISHQIIHGRRMVAATLTVRPNSMDDPQKSFVNTMKRLCSDKH
jgi:hypothetical protein